MTDQAESDHCKHGTPNDPNWACFQCGEEALRQSADADYSAIGSTATQPESDNAALLRDLDYAAAGIQRLDRLDAESAAKAIRRLEAELRARKVAEQEQVDSREDHGCIDSARHYCAACEAKWSDAALRGLEAKVLHEQREARVLLRANGALLEVLHMLSWSCDDVHHERADRHADDAPCPVVCRINELLAACERRKP